jgi:hypothetical protein
MFRFIKTANKGNKKNLSKMKMIRHSPQEIPQQAITFNNMISAKTVSLFSQPYLDRFNQCYKNIVVVNLLPQGPLGSLIKRVNFPPLSEFKQQGMCNNMSFKQCGLALTTLNGYCSIKNGDNLMIVDEVPDLISFLVSNGYTVDTSITKMFNESDIRFDTNTGNKLICFITYNGV